MNIIILYIIGRQATGADSTFIGDIPTEDMPTMVPSTMQIDKDGKELGRFGGLTQNTIKCVEKTLYLCDL